ncbi:MAG: hypothetical protein K1X75_16905 [Leptospirales bacterium]|nr:hypothetical protein [Leptospirales bacterium]
MPLIPDFDPVAVQKAIEKVFAEEKNEAPRYNPFLLLEPDAEFDAMIAENAKEQSIKQLLGK